MCDGWIALVMVHEPHKTAINAFLTIEDALRNPVRTPFEDYPPSDTLIARHGHAFTIVLVFVVEEALRVASRRRWPIIVTLDTLDHLLPSGELKGSQKRRRFIRR